jgi:glycosyltransferase involved in cell wall biosynthesis
MTSVLMTADAVGGVWRYSVDLCRALGRHGVTSTLAVMGPPPGGKQLEDATRAGLRVVHGDFRLEWMPEPWADVDRAGEWLLELERSIQPDLIHLNGYAHATLRWSHPVVVVAHSCVRSWWTAVRGEAAPASVHRYTGAVRAGLAAAHLVVAPTAAMLASLRVEYGAPSCGRVIPNGCRSAGAASTAAMRKQPLILAAGRAWDDAKNIGALCAIADRLPWPVYVAGDHRAPDGTECELPSVHHLGHLSEGDIERWYERASIYALPARYEPFGLSVLEAACAGCALVLGDIASLRENWDGAAIFVRPDDRDALAAAILQLIDRPAARAELGRAAQQRAAAFTMDRTAEGYTRAYETLTT